MTFNITKEVWDGKIPVCFELARYETKSSAMPAPYYALLPRNSYLTLLTQSIAENFNDFVEHAEQDEMWFEFKEKALRWHYPCGVLYDLLCNIDGSDLPWQITVHFHNFPEDELIRCPTQDVIESHFMTVLKEADQLKHRGQVISNMNKNQHQQLWHGLKTDNFEEFWHVNRKFMQGYEDTLNFKSIPVRFYHENQVIQRLINPRNDDNSKDLTLYDALVKVLPSVFSNEKKQAIVVLQGITPPLDSSLQWLCENLSYADNFLHVCIRIS